MQLSKELLGNVIGKEIKEFVIEKNELRYILENDTNSIPELYYINIYELAHKCKEWAFNNGYYLNIYNDAIDVVLKKSCKIVENITDGSFKYSPMLVFKACQWILDNKDK